MCVILLFIVGEEEKAVLEGSSYSMSDKVPVSKLECSYALS